MGRWAWRGTIAWILAGLTVVLLAARADAAMCIQWRSSTTSAVGATADIVLETYVPTGGGSRLRPQRVSEYPFKVTAVAPDGQARPIVVTPDTSGYAWRGQLQVETPGQWTVRVDNFNGDTPCGPVLRIVAGGGAVAAPLTLPIERQDADPASAPDQRSSKTWATAGVGALVAAAIALLVRGRRRRAPLSTPDVAATGVGPTEDARVSAKGQTQL